MAVTNETLRETAYRLIREHILTGELQPGEPISEAERADVLGMSRSPVREALRQLEQEGLVEIFPKRGTFVTDLSARDVREAFELRDAIESACARLAAERRTDEDLRAMAEECDRIDEAAGNEPQAYDHATRFHSLVAAAARSRYLQETFESSQAKIDLASRVAAGSTARPPRDVHHRDIFDAISAGDADRAESLMRHHLQESAKRLIQELM